MDHIMRSKVAKVNLTEILLFLQILSPPILLLQILNAKSSYFNTSKTHRNNQEMIFCKID